MKSDLLTSRRLSDVFNPSSKLGTYALEAHVELPSKFAHVTVIIRNTIDFFLAIADPGRVSIHGDRAKEQELSGFLLLPKGVDLQVMFQHGLTKAVPDAVQCVR